jgi:peroxiredoxin
VIKISDKIPAAIFKELGESAMETVSTDTLFNGRKVVLFSCPGAFTPKSTEKQVPGFLAAAAEFASLGVDEIICISVNDSFVMDAWSSHMGVDGRIRMLADGHCEFHTSIGMQMDCTRFTLGFRSQRFSMLIDDAVVTFLNVEEPGGYDVSDASILLQQMQGRA